jgi:long-chain acyl-CoA synthetase
MSLYCVPLYDSLGENAIEYIVTHSEATIVFVASDKVANLAAALPHVKGQVKNVVYWGAANPAVQVSVRSSRMQQPDALSS